MCIIKKNLKKSHCLFVALAIISLISCSKTEDGVVEYIPFQEATDGQWGMISIDGKVLFSEEFKTKPTIVRDERFFVRTKDGVWEMYSAEEKPQKIGVDYAHTSGFRNGVALVAEKDKPVSIIDTNGKQIKSLDKIEGKIVDGVRAFKNKYAVFMTADSLWGVIDQDGNCVVKPEYYSLNNYGDGKFIGVNYKYKSSVKKNKKDRVKISVINLDGKVLFDMSGDKYENIQNQFTDGLLGVSVKKDTKEIWGLINDKGEVVFKPSSKIKNIGTIHGDNFTYNNGEGWGLMNIKGETLIRAKYEWLYYDQRNMLIAGIKEGDSYNFKYIDEKDNQIGDETYVKAALFSMFDGNHTLVKPNDKTYSIIDKNCKQLEGLPDIADVGTYEGENYIESDYVDLAKLISSMKIKENGVYEISYDTKPQEIVKMCIALGYELGNKEHPAGSPYWYDYKDDMEIFKVFEGVQTLIIIKYTGRLSRQTYRTKRVVDYTIGDYYWYHDDKIPTGYEWNDVIPTTFNIIIRNDGRMHGKLRNLYKLLSSKFKTMGTIAKENNSATIVQLKNGKSAFVAMSKDHVLASWGNLKDAAEINIDEYKDASEEDDIFKISLGYLNELFPDVSLTNSSSNNAVIEADSLVIK